MRKIILIAFIATLMTGCIPFLPGYGGGGPSQEYYRDEPYYGNGGYYANRPYYGRGRSYYGNNYNPDNSYYSVNDHHKKDHHKHKKDKKDKKDKKHKKHHDDD